MLFDQWLYALLPHVLEHAQHHAPAALNHPKDGGLFFVQRAASTRTL
jgi:hypothetical protein